MQYDEQQDNLSPEERKRFDALPRHRTPPPQLEEKIMTELQERGLLKSISTNSFGWMGRIAAAIALLVVGGAGGYFLGTSTTTGATMPKHPLYVLLIRETPTTINAGADLVKEYSEWAGGVYQSGRYITGEKLRETGRILSRVKGALNVTEGVAHVGDGELGGYFIIEAKDYEEAVQVASKCPHLKYGGTIELREIEPT